MRSGFPRVAALLALLLLVLLVSGCGGAKVDFQPEGGVYETGSIEALLETADAGSAAEVMTEEAADARGEALIDLRQQGDEASAVADMLTRGFPEDTAAIPFLVEGATFDGVPVWVVVEAWGDQGATLDHRRVWVFDRSTGDLVFTASRR